MAEEYLRTRVIGIVQPLVNSLLIEMPQNPVWYICNEYYRNSLCLNWLQHFNLCENIRINQEREEENKEEEERKGIPVVPPLQIDEDGIALGKVSLTNFNKKPQ